MKKGISNIRQGRKGGHHVQIARPAEAGRQTDMTIERHNDRRSEW